MAIPSTTKHLLATAWLAPPQGLLPSSHETKTEPAFVATSAVLALLVFVVVTLIFNMKKKSNYFDDVTKGVNTDHDQGSPLVLAFQKRARIEAARVNHWSGPPNLARDPERDAPIREPVIIPVIHEPPRVHLQNSSVEDKTDDSSSGFEDESTLIGKSPYTGNNHLALLSSVDLRRYPTSFVPSKFKPLLPEDVGMEGKVWK